MRPRSLSSEYFATSKLSVERGNSSNATLATPGSQLLKLGPAWHSVQPTLSNSFMPRTCCSVIADLSPSAKRSYALLGVISVRSKAAISIGGDAAIFALAAVTTTAPKRMLYGFDELAELVESKARRDQGHDNLRNLM
jgi:hypothetical protein